MSAYSYYEVLNQAQHLPYEEQLRLLADLAAHVHRQGITRPKHRILELEGLGEEIWKGINIQEYINQERDSWDG